MASVPAEMSVVRFEARGRRFEVRCDDHAYGAVAAMFASLEPTNGASAFSSSFAVTREDATPGQWSVLMDGQLMMSGELLGDALDALMLFVNQRVVSARDDVLSIHAAGVAVDGVGVVMPAPSGGGKTTLCARLIQRGAAYLTDESVGLTADGMMLGYAKPLGFKRGTLQSFADVDLSEVGLGAGPQAVWQVPPARLGADVVANADAGLVVLPRFAVEASLDAHRATRPAAAQAVISQAQNLRSFGTGDALAVVGTVVAGCATWTVSFADASEAAAAVVDLAATYRPGGAVPFQVVRAGHGAGDVPSAHPAPARAVSALCFEEGALLVRDDVDEMAMATTDQIGALVWPLLDGSRSVAAIADSLSGSFDTPAGRIEADVTRWVDQLVELGFVVRPQPDASAAVLSWR